MITIWQTGYSALSKVIVAHELPSATAEATDINLNLSENKTESLMRHAIHAKDALRANRKGLGIREQLPLLQKDNLGRSAHRKQKAQYDIKILSCEMWRENCN